MDVATSTTDRRWHARLAISMTDGKYYWRDGRPLDPMFAWSSAKHISPLTVPFPREFHTSTNIKQNISSKTTLRNKLMGPSAKTFFKYDS